MMYLKDSAVSWSPVHRPDVYVAAHVVEDQRAEDSPVYIKLDANSQLLFVLPGQVRARWDGHEWDPNGNAAARPVPPGPLMELPLPDRLVCAAQDAIEEAALSRWHGHTDVYSVDGHPLDFARSAAGAVIDALAADMDAHDGAGHAALLRLLAQAVRDVKAVA